MGSIPGPVTEMCKGWDFVLWPTPTQGSRKKAQWGGQNQLSEGLGSLWPVLRPGMIRSQALESVKSSEALARAKIYIKKKKGRVQACHRQGLTLPPKKFFFFKHSFKLFHSKYFQKLIAQCVWHFHYGHFDACTRFLSQTVIAQHQFLQFYYLCCHSSCCRP